LSTHETYEKHTKIWSQNLKRKITWERFSHRHENGTTVDFKGMSCEYNPFEGSEFLDSVIP
jgi:hypothetical protein